MLDPERGVLRLLAARGFHPDAVRHWQVVVADDGTPCAAALERGERVSVPDVRADPALQESEHQRFWSLSGIRAVQSIPLTTREGRLIGVLSTHWRDVRTLDDRDTILIDLLARQAADFFHQSKGEVQWEGKGYGRRRGEGLTFRRARTQP